MAKFPLSVRETLLDIPETCMMHYSDMESGCSFFIRPGRRNFLKSLLAASSVALIKQPAAAAQQPSCNFPADSRDRLAVTSYPFRAYIDYPNNHERNPKLPGMDLAQFPAFVAENFKIFNVNPLVNHMSSTSPKYLDSFRLAVEKAHSRLVDLGLPGGRFYAADASVRQSAIDAGCKFVDIAAHVGSPSVRQHVEGSKGDKRDVALAAASLSKLADYGAKRNVVINLENDDPIAEDPFFLVAVMEKAGHPYLRGLPDFGNSLINHTAEYNHKAVGAMLQHVFNMCHVKDVVQNDFGKSAQVDLASLFQLAHQAGYRGFFSMEFESANIDPVTGTKRLVAETLQHLS